MLEICKRHAYTTRGKVTVGICAAVIFIVAMVFGMLVIAAPYAVYADGQKIDEPWVVKANGAEIAIVDSRESGEQVIAGVKAKYYKDIKTQQESELSETVTVEKYKFDDNSVHPVVMSTEQAVENIARMNETGELALGVETTAIVEETHAIKYKTVVKKTATLTKGRTQLGRQGKNGSKDVVARVTTVNGAETERTVLSENVTKKPVTKIVYKGTKKVARRASSQAAQTTNSSYSGSTSVSTGNSYNYAVPSSKNGSAIASYATRFVGLPYVWGGTSLSSGADCSGFTSAIFSRFGVSLPRTSQAQGGAGVRVSASQAAPGDLVCYGGHVGIYLGGGQMVHSSSPGVGVIIGTVNYAPHWFVRVL